MLTMQNLLPRSSAEFPSMSAGLPESSAEALQVLLFQTESLLLLPASQPHIVQVRLHIAPHLPEAVQVRHYIDSVPVPALFLFCSMYS